MLTVRLIERYTHIWWKGTPQYIETALRIGRVSDMVEEPHIAGHP